MSAANKSGRHSVAPRGRSPVCACSKEGAGVAEPPTKAARSLNQQVVSQPEEDNSAHAIVRGDKTKRVRRRLKEASRFVSRNEIRSQD